MLTIAGETFPSVAAAERRIRGILARYATTQVMERLAGADRALIEALIARHPRAQKIIDCGIAHICVQRVPFQEHLRRLVVVRRDGSWRDFSWRKCLHPTDALDDVRRICRRLVADQVCAFARAFWREHPHGAVCPALGVPITPETAHVDHAPPLFHELVQAWLAEEHLEPDDIEIVYRADYGGRSEFADPLLAERWREFHRKHARLRVVSARANLSTLRRRAQHDEAA
jgi:enoyl-CoA hydratase/carnithine racemase